MESDRIFHQICKIVIITERKRQQNMIVRECIDDDALCAQMASYTNENSHKHSCMVQIYLCEISASFDELFSKYDLGSTHHRICDILVEAAWPQSSDK